MDGGGLGLGLGLGGAVWDGHGGWVVGGGRCVVGRWELLVLRVYKLVVRDR